MRSSFELISFTVVSNPLMRFSMAVSRSRCVASSTSILVSRSSSLSKRSENFLNIQPKTPIAIAKAVSRKWEIVSVMALCDLPSKELAFV